MEFTKEQRAAVETRGCDLLVSAAAGSGKTAVLVERIIKLVTEGGVSIDRLLVVTFTEAAAAEMKRRVARALRDRLRLNPGDENLARQLVLLNQAQITTIHAFCLRTARRYFHILGVDPAFRVSDAAETALLKQEVLQELFESLYDDYYAEEAPSPGIRGFIDLVEAYCGRVNDTPLMELVMSLYEFVQSKPWPSQWMDEQCAKYDLDSLDALSATDWYAWFREDAELLLSGAESAIAQALSLADNPIIHIEYFEALAQDAENLKNLKNALGNGIGGFYSALEFEFPRLSGKAVKGAPKDEVRELKERIKGLRDNGYKEPVSKLRKDAFAKPPELLLEDLRALRPFVESLCRVVNAFSERYGAAKRERNIADFNDLEHFALEILLERGSTTEAPMLTDAAAEMQGLFDEIMIDEYQDSNLVQELVLLAVSRKRRGEPNRFMVGDVKQSIYRFRMASPELFREKYNSYGCESGGGALITLAKNFRSRANVLKSANFIFSQIMSDKLGEVEYDSGAALIPGAVDYPPVSAENAATELIIVDDAPDEADGVDAGEGRDSDENGNEGDSGLNEHELSMAEVEARLAAERIRELVDGAYMVYDRENGTRPVRYSDIVVLVRKTALFEAFTRAFKDAGIPAYAGASRGYFGSEEILTMLSILQTIDNPRQDIHLLGALYSPVFGFTADELLEIRGAAKGGCFTDVMTAYLAEHGDTALGAKATAFLKTLNGWRDRAADTPISKLIWDMYEETGYYDYVGAMTGGALRQANLTALFDRAAQYEKTSLKGLFHFVKYIERLLKNDADFGEARIMGENENLVRVMTVHKSKGLEFPVVFVCGLGQRFNLRDAYAPFVMHPSLGFGGMYTDLERRVKCSTFPRYAIGRKLRMESLSEEMRVLYVALTRAKEKLILIGGVRNAGRYLEEKRPLRGLPRRLPVYELYNARNYMDWILPSLLRHNDFGGVLPFEGGERPLEAGSRFIVCIRRREDAAAFEAEEAERDADIFAALMETDPDRDYSGLRGEVLRRLTYQYPWLESCAVPAKLSVSEIKRMYYREFLRDSAELGALRPGAEVGFAVPEFMQPKRAPSPTERGTINHSVLEHVDLFLHRDADALNGLLDELAEKRFIEPEGRKYVDTAAILAFLNSELAERMRRAERIERELPFTAELPAELVNAEWPKDSDGVLVHGIIDCLFEESGETIIVDYKTDYVPTGGLAAVAERYKLQLALYKKAVSLFTGKPVSKAIVYFLGAGAAVEV